METPIETTVPTPVGASKKPYTPPMIEVLELPTVPVLLAASSPDGNQYYRNDYLD